MIAVSKLFHKTTYNLTIITQRNYCRGGTRIIHNLAFDSVLLIDETHYNPWGIACNLICWYDTYKHTCPQHCHTLIKTQSVDLEM